MIERLTIVKLSKFGSPSGLVHNRIGNECTKAKLSHTRYNALYLIFVNTRKCIGDNEQEPLFLQNMALIRYNFCNRVIIAKIRLKVNEITIYCEPPPEGLFERISTPATLPFFLHHTTINELNQLALNGLLTTVFYNL